ncbi:hypothetical protein [Salmonella phage vB_SenS_SB15]|uniref:Uncharacterized protein n=1 Tax=Salmonella phage vB_SenS_SB15 TaxID=2698416 RepID=A0A6B9RI70_9CAUD|nr:hypothetical protein [Salmonella phage vB_SenS_SB15]
MISQLRDRRARSLICIVSSRPSSLASAQVNRKSCATPPC